jgi:hypothetical protein
MIAVLLVLSPDDPHSTTTNPININNGVNEPNRQRQIDESELFIINGTDGADLVQPLAVGNVARYESRRIQWQAALAHSDNMYDLLIASLLHLNGRGDAYLLAAYNKDPNNVLINQRILINCLENPTLSYCASPYLESLLNHDADNGSTLALIAISYYKNGEINRALNLLQQVSLTPMANTHQSELYRQMDYSFARTDLPRDLISLSIQSALLSITSIPIQNSLYSECKNQAYLKHWREACFSAFEHIEKMNPMSADGVIASRLKLFFQNLPESIVASQKAQLMEQQQHSFDKYNQSIEQLLAQIEQGQDAPMIISHTVWEKFLGIYAERGELEALPFLIDQVMTP